MSLPLTRARRARIEPRASYVAMASLTSYFKTVTATEHLATTFSPREPGQKTVKRPVGRPRKRRAEDEIPVETASVSVGNDPTADDDEASVKAIRRTRACKPTHRLR